MNLREAVRKAIESYFEGLEPDQLKATSNKKFKYDKKYFDRMGLEFGVEPYDGVGKPNTSK